MNDNIRSILRDIEEIENTPQGVAIDLRMSLSALILRNLDARGWTQKELSKRAGIKEPHLSRVIHGNANCVLDTAAKLLFALGVRARFEEAQEAYTLDASAADEIVIEQGPVYADEKIIKFERAATQEEVAYG